MADIKILISEEERKEKGKLEELLKEMKKSDKDKLLGFLMGLSFSMK